MSTGSKKSSLSPTVSKASSKGSGKSGATSPNTASKTSIKIKVSKSLAAAAVDPVLIFKPGLTIPKHIPIVTDEPAEYKPIPYTFKISNNAVSVANGSVLNVSYARCPPFYIQLDHALAVIWTLFSQEAAQRPLGVVQLQWALSFLKGLHNQHGKLPQDITVAIDAMEEALITQYAEMAVSDSPAKVASSKKGSTELQLQDGATKDNIQLEKPKLMTQKVPFSVNYAEMSKFKPNHLEQLFKTKEGVSMADVDIQREIDKMAQVVKIHASEGNLDNTCAKDNMVEFLKVFRKEQINKIQEELKRLHSIETFIGNIDKDNFEPYLNNQQIDALDAQKRRSTASCRPESPVSAGSGGSNKPPSRSSSKSK